LASILVTTVVLLKSSYLAPTCNFTQLLIGQIVVAKLIVFRLVHERDVMSLQVSFRQKTLTFPKQDWINFRHLQPNTYKKLTS